MESLLHQNFRVWVSKPCVGFDELARSAESFRKVRICTTIDLTSLYNPSTPFVRPYAIAIFIGFFFSALQLSAVYTRNLPCILPSRQPPSGLLHRRPKLQIPPGCRQRLHSMVGQRRRPDLHRSNEEPRHIAGEILSLELFRWSQLRTLATIHLLV